MSNIFNQEGQTVDKQTNIGNWRIDLPCLWYEGGYCAKPGRAIIVRTRHMTQNGIWRATILCRAHANMELEDTDQVFLE